MSTRHTSGALRFRDVVVVDGTGAPPRRADVFVSHGRIRELVPPGASAGGIDSEFVGGRAEVVEGDGRLTLSPGFIDIHSHSDLAVLHPEAPDLLSPFLSQGVTTQVIGNCGLGAAPAPPERRDTLAALMALIVPAGVGWTWTDYRGYLDRLDAAPLPLNVVPLAAHGALRCAVLGAEPGPARDEPLEAMGELLEDALDAGAFGLSAGLIYPPGLWADTGELGSLCRRVAARDGLFACHVRGSSETALDAERELLSLAGSTGVRTQHSHHEAFGAPHWHLARETLRMEDEARSRGVDVASDVIPYHAVNTSLLAIFPPWALDGGVDALCRRLRDERQRRRIDRDIRERAPQWPPWKGRDGWAHNLVRATGWDNIVVLHAGSTAHRGWTGRSLAAVADAEGRPPFDCAADLTLAARGDVMARYHGVTGAPDDDGVLRELLTHPRHAIGIDVILKGDGVPHPGGYGAVPRWLGLYCRERRWLDLADAVRRVTSLPAERLGLPDRGILAPGAAADLVLFDPEEIGEAGTYEDPTRPPRGIVGVWVNGVAVVWQGSTTGAAGGRLLRMRRSGNGSGATPLSATPPRG